jgi:hypothetical protein
LEQHGNIGKVLNGPGLVELCGQAPIQPGPPRPFSQRACLCQAITPKSASVHAKADRSMVLLCAVRPASSRQRPCATLPAHVFPCQCTLTQSRLWQHHSSRCCTNATMRSSRPLSPTCLVLIYPVPSGDIFPFPNKVTALLSLGELELPMPLPHATVPPPCADHRAPALLQPPDRACLHSAPETT